MRSILISFVFVILLAGFASAITASNCDSSMISYWTFDDDTSYGKDFFDGHDGLVVGTLSDDNLLSDSNPALLTSSGNIDVPFAQALSLQTGFTMELWVGKDPEPTSDSYILKKESSYSIEYTLDNKIKATIGGTTLLSTTVLEVPVLANGFSVTPYHIAITWDATPETLKMYIDGQLEDSGTLAGLTNPVTNLIIGEGFEGLIDELAFYDEPLSQELIRQHYENSNAGVDYCFPTGTGGSSSTKTSFTIEGCWGSGLAQAACSADGEQYCSDSLSLFTTSEANGGCHQPLLDGDTLTCCPEGYYCDDADSPETSKCELMTVVCEDILEKDECVNNEQDCHWTGRRCTSSIRGESCSFYEAELICRDDPGQLGQVGLGTEKVCGKRFVEDGVEIVVPKESCDCEWKDEEDHENDGQCYLDYSRRSSVYSARTPSVFNCLKNFTSGECVDGKQPVTWNAIADDTTFEGVFERRTPNATDLAAVQCIGGTMTRNCGEPIVKLPGFSLIALIASLSIIGLFYILKKDL